MKYITYIICPVINNVPDFKRAEYMFDRTKALMRVRYLSEELREEFQLFESVFSSESSKNAS